MNVFLISYYERLKEWHKLKEQLSNADIQTICVEVDKFWQQCPLVNHYLHPADAADWPTPWELLNDNTYCLLARGLGIFYTLSLLGIKNIDIIDCLDYNNESSCLVVVENYILNWHPGTVLNTSLTEFTNIVYIDVEPIVKKIGKE